MSITIQTFYLYKILLIPKIRKKVANSWNKTQSMYTDVTRVKSLLF